MVIGTMNTMSQGPAVSPANSASTKLLGSAAAPVAIVAAATDSGELCITVGFVIRWGVRVRLREDWMRPLSR
jgi:hypothetical protein